MSTGGRLVRLARQSRQFWQPATARGRTVGRSIPNRSPSFGDGDERATQCDHQRNARGPGIREALRPSVFKLRDSLRFCELNADLCHWRERTFGRWRQRTRNPSAGLKPAWLSRWAGRGDLAPMHARSIAAREAEVQFSQGPSILPKPSGGSSTLRSPRLGVAAHSHRADHPLQGATSALYEQLRSFGSSSEPWAPECT